MKINHEILQMHRQNNFLNQRQDIDDVASSLNQIIEHKDVSNTDVERKRNRPNNFENVFDDSDSSAAGFVYHKSRNTERVRKKLFHPNRLISDSSGEENQRISSDEDSGVLHPRNLHISPKNQNIQNKNYNLQGETDNPHSSRTCLQCGSKRSLSK